MRQRPPTSHGSAFADPANKEAAGIVRKGKEGPRPAPATRLAYWLIGGSLLFSSIGAVLGLFIGYVIAYTDWRAIVQAYEHLAASGAGAGVIPNNWSSESVLRDSVNRTVPAVTGMGAGVGFLLGLIGSWSTLFVQTRIVEAPLL